MCFKQTAVLIGLAKLQNEYERECIKQKGKHLKESKQYIIYDIFLHLLRFDVLRLSLIALKIGYWGHMAQMLAPEFYW